MEHLIHLKESLVCNICQKKFDRKRDLKLHCFHHDTLSCDVCQKVFKHPKYLKRHYRVHTGEKPYECEVCLKRYSHPSSFNKHCQTHSGRQFVCHICGKQFLYKHHLTKHQSIHDVKFNKQQIKSFDCNVCFKSFATIDQLNGHLSSHSSKKPFKCNVCPKQFVYKQGLARHYQSHLLKCDKCTKVFYSETDLNRHKSIHNGKTSKGKGGVQKKLSDVKSLINRNQISEKNGIYECKECKKTYNAKKNIQRHLLIHEEKRYACDVCNKSYFRKDHLQRHYLYHTGKKSYEAKKYSKKNLNFKNLNKNKLIRTKKSGSVSKKNEKKLDSRKSKNLKNSISYSSILNSPTPYVRLEKLNIRDNEKNQLVSEGKNYICDVCNRNYSTEEKLGRHSLIHSRKEFYKCEKCSKVFFTAVNLNKHKFIHTYGYDSVAEECEASFVSQSDFDNHCPSVENASSTDVSLEKLSTSQYSDAITEKKSYDCKKFKRKQNYLPSLQKYLRTQVVGKSFICDVCDKIFHRKDIFESHCLSHSGVTPYECRDCDKKFIYRSSLRQHMIIHKSQKPESSLVCEICMEKFSTPYNLRRHAKVHINDKRHMCNICQVKFADATQLKRHCDRYKGKEVYDCADCERGFHLRRSLHRHLLSHKIGPVPCDKCLKRFANQQSLRLHQDGLFCRKTPSFNIGGRFSDKSNLNNNKLNHLEKLSEVDNEDNNNNVCNICHKSFANAKLFKYHMNSYKGRKTYECTKCVKKFHRRQNLCKHALIHNTNSSEQRKDVHSGKISSSSYIRDMLVDESKQLNPCITDSDHLNEIHSENEYNVCNICHKSFANSRLFKYHLDSYKGKKAYECTKCMKKFHKRESLTKHLAIHKTKGSQCDVCLKIFDDPVSLEQHIHVISGDASYECNIQDIFRGESIKNLIRKGLGRRKKPNPYTTEKPHVIYIGQEIQK